MNPDAAIGRQKGPPVCLSMHQLLRSAERRNELLKPQEKLKKLMHGHRYRQTDRQQQQVLR
jgi:hypothetical protein